MEKRVPIGEELTAYLQMLSYEYDGLRVLVAQVVRSGDGDGALYGQMMEDYKEAGRRWRTALDEVIRMAAPKCLGWMARVDFAACELILEERQK